MFKLLKKISFNIESIARDLRYIVVYIQQLESKQQSTLKKMEK